VVQICLTPAYNAHEHVIEYGCTCTTCTMYISLTIFLFRSGIAFYFPQFRSLKGQKNICVFMVTCQKKAGKNNQMYARWASKKKYRILTNLSIFVYLLVFIYVICCLISSNVLLFPVPESDSGISFLKFPVSRHLLHSFSTFFALNFDKKLAVE
jgi:hypothetical protein